MRYNEAFKELQYKRQKRFILTGEESYLKDSFINAMISLNGDSNVFKYYPGDEDEAKSTLYSSTLFGEDQIVVLHYYDEMKSTGFKKIIQKYSGYLVVELSADANLKNASLIEVAGLCIHVQCSKMSEYGPEYPSWLVSKASEKNFSFINDAETFLYKKVGPDMLSLSIELEKLMVYKSAVREITPEDIEKVTSFSAITTPFDILDSLLKKDIPGALKSFEQYMLNSDSIDGLIFFFGQYFEKLYKILLMYVDKISVDGIASIVGMPAYIVRSNYLPRAIELGPNRLSQVLNQIVMMEVSSRVSGLKRNIITSFIFSFS